VDTELNRGGYKNTQNTNKISAVKRKHGNLRFNQQQGSSSSALMTLARSRITSTARGAKQRQGQGQGQTMG